MMKAKKIFVLFFTLFFIYCLAGCSGDSNSSSGNDPIIKKSEPKPITEQPLNDTSDQKNVEEDNAVADYDFGGKMVPCINIGKYRNVPLEYIAEHDQSYLQWCISDKCNFMPASKNFIKKYIK